MAIVTDPDGTKRYVPDFIAYQEPERSLSESAGRTATVAAGGFNKGLADTAEFVAPPLRGRMDWLRDLGSPPKPDRWWERWAERIGEELGMSAPIAGAQIGAAGQLAKRLTPAQRVPVSRLTPMQQAGQVRPKLDLVKRPLTAPLRAIRLAGDKVQRPPASVSISERPGRASLGEAANAALSGAGAAAAQDLAPGSVPAEIAGQVLGPIAPNAVKGALRRGGSIAGAGARMAVRAFDEDAAREQAAAAVAPELQNVISHGDVPANLARNKEIADQIEGFEPSIGQMSGDKTLAATEQAIERALPQDKNAARLAKHDANRKAVSDYEAAAAPKSDIDPDTPYVTASKKRRAAMDDQKAREEQQRLTEEAFADDYLPVIDPTGPGSKLRDQYWELRDAARQEMRRLSSELGLEDLPLSVTWADLAPPFLARFQATSDIQDAREVVPAVIRRLGALAQDNQKAGNQLTFGDLKAFKEQITNDMFEARAADKKHLVRELRAAQGLLEKVMDDIFEEADPELAGNYRRFRQIYKERFIDRFERGAARQTKRKDGVGDYRTVDEDVADNFLTDVTSARQFNRTFEGDEAANEALRSAVYDDLRAFAVNDGVLNGGRFRQWLAKKEAILNEFPDIKADLEDFQTAHTRIRARGEELAARRRRIEDNALSRRVRQIDQSQSGKTPESLIVDALRDPRSMRRLNGYLRGHPEARQALKRQVWEAMMARNAEQIDDALTNPKMRNSLVKVLGEKHVRDIGIINEARKMLEAVPPASASPLNTDPTANFRETTGMGAPQLASRIFAVQSGRTSARFVAVEFLSRMLRGFNQKDMMAAYDAALHDPEVAATLAKTLRASDIEVAKREARHLRTLLFRIGVTGSEELKEEPSVPLAR